MNLRLVDMIRFTGLSMDAFNQVAILAIDAGRVDLLYRAIQMSN